MGLFRVFLLQSYKWIGWVGLDWDLCVGLLYEHRFAVLIKREMLEKIKREMLNGHQTAAAFDSLFWSLDSQ